MAPVFKISNGRCVGIDNEAYKKLSRDAEVLLVTGMKKTPFRYLPAKKGDLARKMARGLFSSTGRPEEICRALANKLPPKAESWASMERAKKGPPEKEEEKPGFLQFLEAAKERGFFMTGATPVYTCPDEIEWEKGKYYYSGSPSCENVKNILEKYKDSPIPVTMSVIHAPYLETMRQLLAPGALRILFNTNEYKERPTPFYCTGKVPAYEEKMEGGKRKLEIKGYKDVRAIYNYPFNSTWWALRHIIGIKELYYRTPAAGIAYWHQVPSCKSGGKTYEEDKLLFNFGMRIYLKLDIEVDGRPENRTLLISTIASTTESDNFVSNIRDKFMSGAHLSFYSGELTKMYYTHWLNAK